MGATRAALPHATLLKASVAGDALVPSFRWVGLGIFTSPLILSIEQF